MYLQVSPDSLSGTLCHIANRRIERERLKNEMEKVDRCENNERWNERIIKKKKNRKKCDENILLKWKKWKMGNWYIHLNHM